MGPRGRKGFPPSGHPGASGRARTARTAILSGTLAALSSIGTVFLGSGLAMVASTAVMYFLFADLAAAKY